MTKLEALKHVFGHSAFRPGQEQIVDHLLAGGDALCVMPTGAGKSVCYQVPALLMPGVTVVVSPLISLMKDQVGALTQAGVAAAFINSSLTPAQCAKALDGVAAGKYRIVYAAPERLETQSFLDAAVRAGVSMVAVDEAHCVSQWGQDFRPSYLKIRGFIAALPQRPVVAAFTATATREVREDILHSLGLCDPLEITTGFDRPNLWFGVCAPRDKKAELLRRLDGWRGRSGIVYCATRKTVDEVCALLCERGYAAARYHAGLTDEERRRSQDDFLCDRVTVMVATNAFGMGIDKSNVSFVVHYNMPKDVESYYQEAGRAGRDGSPAECLLLYAPQDVHTNRFLIEHGEEPAELDEAQSAALREREYERLRQMTFYATTTECLRVFLLRYFGERAHGACGNCSNCEQGFEERDATREAQMILSCIARMGQRYGAKLVVDVLRGSRAERVTSLGFDRLSTYGLLKDEPEAEVRRVLDALLASGDAKLTDSEYPVLALTPSSGEVLRGERAVTVRVPLAKSRAAKKRGKGSAAPADEGLFGALRALRAQCAAAAHVPAYVVFTDAALRDMAAKKPRNEDEFLEVSGVGDAKLRRYGRKFLDCIAQYEREHPES